jgi:acetyl/propionyl-CoA carboxylase alpha subunit
MGLKREAKRIARGAGVPVVPGYDGDDQSDARLAAEAEAIGFPCW